MRFKDLKLGDWFSFEDELNTTYIMAEDGKCFVIDSSTGTIGAMNILVADEFEDVVLKKFIHLDRDYIEHYTEIVSDVDLVNDKFIKKIGKIFIVTNEDFPEDVYCCLIGSNNKIICIKSNSIHHYAGEIIDSAKINMKFFSYICTEIITK